MPNFDTSAENILKILKQGEGQTVEFKQRLPRDSVIATSLAAFANSQGGILLIGVTDDGTPVGLSLKEAGRVMGRLTTIASSLLDVPGEIGSLDFSGRQIIYAAVDKAPLHLAPILTSKGDQYVRRDSRNMNIKDVVDGPPSAVAEEERADALTGAMYEETMLEKWKGDVAFVAISFRDEEEPALVDYYKAMERALKRSSLSLRLKRIDIEEGDYEISQKVMDEIDGVALLIADFTLGPANVYFELGYARGRGIRIIQTARKDTILEFDVRNWRTLFYRNATELEERLVPAFNQVSEELKAQR